LYFQIDQTAVRIASTVHDFPRESPDLPRWLSDAFDWCEDLILESSPFANPDAATHFFGDSPLRKLVGFDTWLALCMRWPRFCLGRKMYKMKPWAALSLMPHLLLRLVPGAEIQLANRAKRESKPVGQLETIADLARHLESVPAEVFRVRFQSLLRNLNAERQNIVDFHDAWYRGDFPCLTSLAQRLPVMNIPEMRQAYLLARNQSWLKSIRNATQSKRRTLILVGAVHLCGPGNLVELYQTEFEAAISPIPVGMASSH
jgi:uncharacterized protein YbaP (TraB family)